MNNQPAEVVLTRARAQAILEEAQRPVAFPACCAPWVDRIKLTPQEKAELNRAWDLLPGWATQLMALTRIAKGTLEVPVGEAAGAC